MRWLQYSKWMIGRTNIITNDREKLSVTIEILLYLQIRKLRLIFTGL